MSTKWDNRFMELAMHIASWSKDPSTRTGAVIVAPDRRIVSLGFNGFPRGVKDDERLFDRDQKYQIIVHCERNAMLFAREPLQGCTLYTWPFVSCGACAAMMIQAGITRHVAPRSEHPRFGEKQQPTEQILKEAGVLMDFLVPHG